MLTTIGTAANPPSVNSIRSHDRITSRQRAQTLRSISDIPNIGASRQGSVAQYGDGDDDAGFGGFGSEISAHSSASQRPRRPPSPPVVTQHGQPLPKASIQVPSSIHPESTTESGPTGYKYAGQYRQSDGSLGPTRHTRADPPPGSQIIDLCSPPAAHRFVLQDLQASLQAGPQVSTQRQPTSVVARPVSRPVSISSSVPPGITLATNLRQSRVSDTSASSSGSFL